MAHALNVILGMQTILTLMGILIVLVVTIILSQMVEKVFLMKFGKKD